MQEKAAKPEAQSKAAEAANGHDAEAWRTADPYAMFPKPEDNRAVHTSIPFSEGAPMHVANTPPQLEGHLRVSHAGWQLQEAAGRKLQAVVVVQSALSGWRELQRGVLWFCCQVMAVIKLILIGEQSAPQDSMCCQAHCRMHMPDYQVNEARLGGAPGNSEG